MQVRLPDRSCCVRPQGNFAEGLPGVTAQLAGLRSLVALLDPELADAVEHAPELEGMGAGFNPYHFGFEWAQLLGKRQFSASEVRPLVACTPHVMSCYDAYDARHAP